MCVLGFLFCYGAMVAHSDEVNPPRGLVLSLEECERMTLERNLTALRAEAGVDAAHAAVREARAAILPHLDFSSRYTRLGPTITFEVPTEEGSQQITVGPALNRNATVSLSQAVYAVGPTKLARRAAAVGIGLSEATLANIRDEVILAARQAFFNCLRAKALLDVAKQRQEQAQAHLGDAEAYYQAGTAPRADVLRAQVEVANAEHLALAAQNGVDLAFIALRNLLNLGQEVPLDLKVPEVPKLVEPNLGRCLEAAKMRRADLTGATLGIELSRAKEALAASETKPTVFLAGDRQWKTSTGFSSPTSWSLSLVASMPIFDGGAGSAKVERARRETEQGELDLQALGQAVEAQVRGALLSLEASRKQIEVAQVAIEQAQEALRITELQYKEGVARSVEVLDAEVALTQASTNHVNALYDYETAKAGLARAAGVYSVGELIEQNHKSPPRAAVEEATAGVEE